MKVLAPLLNKQKRRREDSSQERETTERSQKSPTRKEYSQKKRKVPNEKKGRLSASGDGRAVASNQQKNRSKKKKGPLDLRTIECYNCGELGHGSWKCPKKQNPERIGNAKRAHAKNAEKDLANSSPNKVNKKSNKSFLTTPSQCLEGSIAFLIPVTFCLDTGATISLIDVDLAKRLRKSAGIEYTEFHVDMSIVTVDENHKIMIEKKCRVDIEIRTKCKKFLVCRNVEFYIAKMKMTEVILGNKFLMSLGIDVCEELALVAARTPEWNFEDEEVPMKSARGVEFEILEERDFEPPRCGEIPADHPDFGDDMPDPIEDLLGGNDPIELRKTLDDMIERAIWNGLDIDSVESMKTLLIEYEEIWRLRLGSDPPVKVTPMKCELKPGFEPYKAANRRYSPLVQDFMKVETERQIKWRFAYQNPESQWASSPFCVRKRVKEGEKLPPLIDLMRMTVDLREVNKRMTTTVWPMPNLEVVLGAIAGAKCFALFDLTSGYWQFPLDLSCREFFSYITDRGIFTPTRVPQGAAGSVAYVQASMCHILGDELLYVNAIPWIDDVLMWANSDKELVELLRKLFERCKSFGLKLHAKKSQLYTRSAIWCGRMINAEGVSHDPSRLNALRSISLPVNGADLQQFICAVNWLRMTLPNYAKTIAPLMSYMEKVYKIAKGRSKK